MKLDSGQVAKLEAFLDKIKTQTYPEPPSVLHDDITRKMLDRVYSISALPAGAAVLDVGCGQGVALKHFVERGCDATGITLNATDVQEARKLNFNVLEMDQSFLDFPEGRFDLLWCRHCLEHSIFPYFTLSEFFRVLKPGGWLYIEVPAPDTACNHQNNANHYSVLGKTMLANLITRSGFKIKDIADIKFTVVLGPDIYWAIIAQKP